jgi:heat shock protein HtpX
MYEQIAKNKRASLVLIVIVAGALLGVGYVIGFMWSDRAAGGVILASLLCLLGLVWAAVAYYRGAAMILSLSRAREVNAETEPKLCNVVEEMAIASGLPLPRVFVIRDKSPNALATGRDPDHAAVAVTSGLLATLDRQELQGVVAHEMAHIRNYDIRLGTLVGIMVGLIVGVAVFFLNAGLLGLRAAGLLVGASRPRRRRRRKKDEVDFGVIFALLFVFVALIAMASAAIAGLAYPLARLTQLAISRQREYLADASAVELTRDPIALARALEKIALYSGSVQGATGATAHLFIASPFGKARESLAHLFDTHPPIEQRIAILREIGHEPKEKAIISTRRPGLSLEA